MTKAIDILNELVEQRYAKGLGAFPSEVALVNAVSAKLRSMGIPYALAQYDKAGDCLTCGEAGRCPGVHTFEEIQEANKLANASTIYGIMITEDDLTDAILDGAKLETRGSFDRPVARLLARLMLSSYKLFEACKETDIACMTLNLCEDIPPGPREGMRKAWAAVNAAIAAATGQPNDFAEANKH